MSSAWCIILWAATPLVEIIRGEARFGNPLRTSQKGVRTIVQDVNVLSARPLASGSTLLPPSLGRATRGGIINESS